MGRQEQDFGFWGGFCDRGSGNYAAGLAKSDVEENDVRLERSGFLYRFRPVRSFTNDLATFLFENDSDVLSPRRKVINDDNARRERISVGIVFGKRREVVIRFAQRRRQPKPSERESTRIAFWLPNVSAPRQLYRSLWPERGRQPQQSPLFHCRKKTAKPDFLLSSAIAPACLRYQSLKKK